MQKSHFFAHFTSNINVLHLKVLSEFQPLKYPVYKIQQLLQPEDYISGFEIFHFLRTHFKNKISTKIKQWEQKAN